ncbi:hypothetical protein A3I40_02480 [Candidatus Uhrbacteria bacterium RIFCSPLOWO2_02_FULL_48_12]|uniref:Large ribosomal subunit protein bL25 n=1 Tax=Candidatus Uhrbacteria bacterium RIFCSPLOWO2_02_FULL_48_12 TaxID=1802407 RepID=A0A1F7VA27_9BACT|nr:MAG: hypothetical protein A3I40_02480 [Candidatus Uhrbacteria bacterium RIFCSPLOWO2_02_FULL_48_12]
MTYSLQALVRTAQGKKSKSLLKQGLVPGIVYGHGESNRLVALKRVPFEKLFMTAGESSLVDLNIDEHPSVKVLIHEVQRHPLTGKIIHVDFYQVKMTEKITAEVPVIFDGEARAVKELGGVLVKTLDHVKVECLPQNLVHELHVDLGALNTFEDAIHVRDLRPPEGVKILIHAEDVIVKVQPPRTEEELKAELAEAPEAAAEAVPVVGKEGKEQEAEQEKETSKEAEKESGKKTGG